MRVEQRKRLKDLTSTALMRALSSEDEVARWYFVLRSPLRLRIIRLLGEKGPLPFKELKRELGAGVGTIYYHLSIMSELVEQDEKRRYYLSELGMRVFTALKDGTLSSVVRRPTVGEAVLKGFLLSPLLRTACEDLRIGIPLAVLMLLLGAFGCSQARLMPVLMFYARTSVSSPIYLFLHYMGQQLLIFLACEGLSILFLRRIGGEAQLAIGVAVASLPMALFPYIYMLTPSDVASVLLPFFHLWAILLICSAISLGKGTRLDRSLPIGIIFMFINMLLLVFLGLLRF